MLNTSSAGTDRQTKPLGACLGMDPRPQAERSGATTPLPLAAAGLWDALAELSHVGMNLVQDGRFQYVNRRVAEIFGYTSEEFLAQDDWLFFVHPDDRPLVVDQVRQRIDGSSATSRYVFRGKRKDGTTVYVDVHGARTTFRGRPAAIATLLDVTERYQAEELRNRFAATLEATSDLVAMTHVEGPASYINAAGRKLLGLGADQQVSLLEHQPRWAQELVAREVLPTVLRLGSWTGEIAYLDDQGREVPVSQVVLAHKSVRGEVEFLSILARDIRAAKLAEEALRASEGRYRELFEANPLPMWVFDHDTLRFLAVNEAAVQHYGYRRDEFLAMTLQDIRPAEQADRLLGEVSGPLPVFGAAQVWKHRKKDGSVIDVEITAHDFVFEGRPGRLVLALDVTERTRLEEQLRQAQKMDAVGQLAGGVAHDFNNLLTVINGYSELLLSGGAAADEAVGLLEEVRKAGERAAALTRQLLAFSRKEMVQPVVLDLNAVVEGMEKMLRRVIGEDIALTASLTPTLGLVRADPGQLEQVLLNLAVNARDAMPRGGQLTIETANVMLDAAYARTHPAVQPGPYVLLAASDTGCGMTEAVKARIFEPFFTTKEPGRGTGLGLATVYGIVKQSGGGIGVYSEPGQGATFKVYLPRIRATNGAEDRHEATTLRGGAETLLVAEDDPMVRGFLRRVLQGAGYTVLEADSGPEALRLARERKDTIHLLITDVVMPGMSGRQLANQLAAERGDLRVLYLSGYTNDAVVRHGVLQAEVIFLQKPFTPAALTQKVRHVLDTGP